MVRATAQQHERTRRYARRQAFTLVEMAVTLAIMSVLMTALGSVIVLASRALPHNEPATTAAAAAGLVADQIAAELRYATRINLAGTTALEFVVPDRNNDGAAETIRYEWSGSPGDPLTRRYNGGGPVEVLSGVQNFSFAYERDTVTTEVSSPETNDSGEVLLAKFDGWGSAATQAQAAASSTSWASQAFTIDQVAIPSDVTRVQITRVGLKLKRPLSGGPSLSVAIHPRTGGSYIPDTTPIGTPTVLAASDLATYFATIDVRLNDVVLADPALRDLAIVVKGSGTNSVYVQYQTYTSAPANSSAFFWTTNSGGAWQPVSTYQHRNDAVFYVYGSYQWTSSEQTINESYTLRTASISLEIPGGRADTMVRTINSPEVPGP